MSAKKMKVQQFRLIVGGADPNKPETAERIAEAGFEDAELSRSESVYRIDFERPGASALAIIVDTICLLEEAVRGIYVLRVEPAPIVSLTAIAERTGLTHEAVRSYAIGRRGPGGFPAPIHAGEGIGKLWHWSEVAQWFLEHSPLSKKDVRAEISTAVAISAVNSRLLLRSVEQTLTQDELSTLARLTIGNGRSSGVTKRKQQRPKPRPARKK